MTKTAIEKGLTLIEKIAEGEDDMTLRRRIEDARPVFWKSEIVREAFATAEQRVIEASAEYGLKDDDSISFLFHGPMVDSAFFYYDHCSPFPEHVFMYVVDSLKEFHSPPRLVATFFLFDHSVEGVLGVDVRFCFGSPSFNWDNPVSKASIVETIQVTAQIPVDRPSPEEVALLTDDMRKRDLWFPYAVLSTWLQTKYAATEDRNVRQTIGKRSGSGKGKEQRKAKFHVAIMRRREKVEAEEQRAVQRAEEWRREDLRREGKVWTLSVETPVEGHYRNQFYPSEGVYRRIFVPSYTKGKGLPKRPKTVWKAVR